MRILLLLLISSLALAQAAPSQTQSPSASATPAPPPDSTKLVITHYVKPTYPLAASAREIQGQVTVRITVNTNGEVETADVVSGEPILRDAALEAVRKWKFQPYIHNGHAVNVTTTLPVDFVFADKVTDYTEKDKGAKLGHYSFIPPSPDSAKGEPSSSANTDNTAKTVRIGQAVSEGLLLHSVRPVYPPIARNSGVQGTVVLQAVIGKDGRIERLRALSGPDSLRQAAIDAVQQWRYKPYLLNNEPVEVDTQITVNFQLRR